MDINSNLPTLSSDEINKIDEFRKAKQTAVLVIMFSDIVNSTYATEKLGEQSYSKLRHVHDELFIRIMTYDNAGRVIKEIGDSFLCVFSEPSTAVLRAVEFQNAIHLNKENLTIDDYTLKVKIGIHIGQVALENNLALDIFGRHVNRAARIQSMANGGQILTSQAIWENAIGWIKSQGDSNIKSFYYGKARLKGVSEKVDIYCFYDVKTGKPSSPEYFKKKKLRIGLILIASIVLMMVASFYILENLNKLKQNADLGVMSQTKKTYYVQFDFSDLEKQSIANKSKLIIDTISLEDDLLSQLIAIFNPDSVVTEQDLKKQYSKNGAFYVRHQNRSSRDSYYFRDSLNFFGSLFITANENISTKNDSIQLHIRLDMYPDHKGSSAAESNQWFSISDIETPFRNLTQDLLLRTSDQTWTIQGYVTNSNDSVFYFQFTQDASLRVGASIGLFHEYIGLDGLYMRLEDLKKGISFFEKIPEDSLIVKQYFEECKVIENRIYINDTNSRWSSGAGVIGKVTEIYDSTGKATWKNNGRFPYDKPRKGDVIYLAY